MAVKGYKFTVSGLFPFPHDMLRYDGCYPADSESAAEIKASDAEDRERRTYTVRLISTFRHPPTDGRWSSFLWSVDPDSVEPIR